MLLSMGLPPSMLVATHINRTENVLQMSIEGGLAGVSLDITTLYSPDNGLPDAVPPAKALRMLREAGVPFASITMSSDGNAIQPFRDEKGGLLRIMLCPVNGVAVEIAKAVTQEHMPLEEILPLVTSHAADGLRIGDRTGRLEAGKDADVVLLDEHMQVDTVIAKGKMMLKDKIPLVVGYYEKDYAELSV